MRLNTVGWIETGTATNATAIATRPALPTRQHAIGGISGSFSTTPAAPVLMVIKFGTTVVYSVYITGAFIKSFPFGCLDPNSNEAVSAELSTGGAGVIGYVNLHGVTLTN